MMVDSSAPLEVAFYHDTFVFVAVDAVVDALFSFNHCLCVDGSNVDDGVVALFPFSSLLSLLFRLHVLFQASHRFCACCC